MWIHYVLFFCRWHATMSVIRTSSLQFFRPCAKIIKHQNNWHSWDFYPCTAMECVICCGEVSHVGCFLPCGHCQWHQECISDWLTRRPKSNSVFDSHGKPKIENGIRKKTGTRHFAFMGFDAKKKIDNWQVPDVCAPFWNLFCSRLFLGRRSICPLCRTPAQHDEHKFPVLQTDQQTSGFRMCDVAIFHFCRCCGTFLPVI